MNSTPGGCFADIKEEVRNCKALENTPPKYVVLFCGTNDMAKHFLLDRGRNSFHCLIAAAQKKYPKSKASSFSSFIHSLLTREAGVGSLQHVCQGMWLSKYVKTYPQLIFGISDDNDMSEVCTICIFVLFSPNVLMLLDA